MDNAAFDPEGDLVTELDRILAKVAEYAAEYALDGVAASGPVFDINGNNVGEWRYVHD